MCSCVIPLLLDDNNDLYPRTFSPAISSPTLIEKKVPNFLDLDIFCCFFYFSQSNLREATWHSALLNSTLSVGACQDTRRHVWGQLLSQLPLNTCEDNCSFFSKSYLYLYWKSRTKFPADWRNINFLSGWESKICWS